MLCLDENSFSQLIHVRLLDFLGRSVKEEGNQRSTTTKRDLHESLRVACTVVDRLAKSY
jgi:hypothetical protein